MADDEDTFTDQFFNVDRQNNIRNLHRDIVRYLSRKEAEFHEKIRKEQALLNFVIKIGLFLQLKTNNKGNAEQFYGLLTGEPFNMRIAQTDSIAHESDIMVCEELLQEAKELKLSFPALEKIKLIKKLWDDAIAAERYCQSCGQHVLKLIYGDCFTNLEKSIVALKRSGIFAREYHDVNFAAADEHAAHVRNGEKILPNRDENSKDDWFNGLASRFRNRTLAGIEERYERLKEQREAQASRLVPQNIGQRPHYDFRAKRGKKTSKKAKKSVKKTKKSTKKTKKSVRRVSHRK